MTFKVTDVYCKHFHMRFFEHVSTDIYSALRGPMRPAAELLVTVSFLRIRKVNTVELFAVE